MNISDSHYSDSIFGRQNITANTNSFRRGSSIFGFQNENEVDAYDQMSESYCEPGSLLVDFPERDCEDFGYSHKRHYNADDHDEKMSGVTNENLTSKDSRQLHDDSISSNSIADRDSGGSACNNKSGTRRLGEAARMEQLANMQNKSGNQNHRPLVGGFAAAAYEAMRDHHYSDRALDCDTSEASDSSRMNHMPSSS